MKIKRADIERILILLRGGAGGGAGPAQQRQTTSQVLVEQTAIPIEQTIAQEDTVATVVFYEDGDGYLVPVTRQVPKTDGIAKAHACADGQGCGKRHAGCKAGPAHGHSGRHHL